MSCYEWERGTLTLPTAEAAPMRKALNAAHAAQMNRVKALLDRLWPELKNLPADKRRDKASSWSYPNAAALASDEVWDDLDTLFHASEGRKPTAEHWKKVLAAPSTNRTNSWMSGEAVVVLSGRRLMWRVEENNHAVDRAHEKWLGRALFAQLDRVKWTRGSGGVFTGNDEYNQDSDYEGGGGNYITYEYGPPSKKAVKPHHGFTRI